MTQPTLYSGLRVPFDKLEPEPFASFVYGALQALADERHWYDFAQPDVGADGGFDSTARRREDNALVCFQCKRYSEAISIPELASELVRLSFTEVFEAITVAEFVMVTSGTVRTVLREALRDDTRDALTKKCLELATSDEKFRVARKNMAAYSKPVDATVRAFVAKVSITVWSGNEFDVQLGLVWSKLSGLIDKTFVVHSLVRERPRPDFREADYLARHRARAGAEPLNLYVRPQSGVPHVNGPRGDPLAGSVGVQIDAKLGEPLATVTLLDKIESSVSMLVGPGGGGKSTTLRQWLSLAAARRIHDPEAQLPVFVDLAGYAGALREDIDSAFGLTFGTWAGIPGPILLLLDGLDLVPRSWLPLLERDLRFVNTLGRVRVIVSCRPGGPAGDITIPGSIPIWALLPCGLSHALTLGRRHLAPADVPSFLDDWLIKAHTDEFVARPQGLAGCIVAYRDAHQLPNTRRALLDHLLGYRESAEASRARALPDELAVIPFSTARWLAARVAYRTWLLSRRSRVAKEEFLSSIKHSVTETAAAGAFGAGGLTDASALVLLLHLGLVHRQADGTFCFEHDALAALLASDVLATEWRNSLARLEHRHGDDAWVLAASRLAAAERLEYLQAVLAADPVTAAECAVEMGTPELLEGDLLQWARAATGQIQIAYAAHALHVLSTATCRQFLWDKVNKSPDGYGGWFRAAAAALASCGDAHFLTMVLERLEMWRSTPVKMSGGEAAWWEMAPPSVALTIARRRLSEEVGKPCAASVETVVMFGVPDDAELIATALSTGQTLESLRRGIQWLYRLSPEVAERVFATYVAGADDGSKVYLYELGRVLGWPVDDAFLVEFLLRPYQVDPSVDEIQQRLDHGAWQSACSRAARLLAEVPISDASANRLVATEPPGDADLMGWLWTVACGHPSSEWDAKARAALEGRGEVPIGCAARYAASRSWPSTECESLVARVRTLVQDTAAVGSWHAARLIELLVAWGARVDAAAGLDARLRHALAPGSGDARESLDRMFEFGRYSTAILRLIDNLDIQGLSAWLAEDLSSCGGDGLAAVEAICTRLTDADLDARLAAAPDGMRECLLAIASRCGRTDARVRVLEQSIQAIVRWAAPAKEVAEAVGNLWSEDVARSTLAAFGAGTWSPDVRDQLAGPVLEVVVGRLAADDVPRLIEPAIQAATDPIGRDVLVKIREIVMRRR